MPYSHPPEVRAAAVRLVRDGLRPPQAARRAGVDPSTLHAWLKEDAPELVCARARRCWRCYPDVQLDAAAYAHLLGLYLGDGWIVRLKATTFLSVACDDAWPGLADECAQVMLQVFATSVCRVRRNGCHDMLAYSQHWPCLFPQHGPGKKHTSARSPDRPAPGTVIAVPTTPTAPARGPLRVLVAEDEALIRMDLVEMLEEDGYVVVGQAGDGEAAVRLATELRPDLVILDVKMPVLDGLSAAEQVVAARIAPVVILTAFSQRDLVERAREAGVMAYLVKPFQRKDLVPAIEMAVSRFTELVALEKEVRDLSGRL